MVIASRSDYGTGIRPHSGGSSTRGRVSADADRLACRPVDPVRISYSADERFVRQVAAANVDRRGRVLTIVSGVLAALATYLFFEGSTWVGIIVAISTVLVGGAAMGAQRPSRDVAKSLRAQFQALPPPATIAITVDDDGMEFENAHGAQHLPWDSVRSVHRTKKIWFVHTTTDQSLPIPVSAMTPEAEAVIRGRVPLVTDGTEKT